jgi:hypothetical protein
MKWGNYLRYYYDQDDRDLYGSLIMVKDKVIQLHAIDAHGGEEV